MQCGTSSATDQINNVWMSWPCVLMHRWQMVHWLPWCQSRTLPITSPTPPPLPRVSADMVQSYLLYYILYIIFFSPERTLLPAAYPLLTFLFHSVLFFDYCCHDWPTLLVFLFTSLPTQEHSLWSLWYSSSVALHVTSLPWPWWLPIHLAYLPLSSIID